MGLSPYGNPDSDEVKKWKRVILEELVDVREDGSFLLNMDYFDYATGLTMCNDALWERLFGISRRELESELTQPHMNLALAIQQVTEEILLRLAQTAKEITSSNHLVMAGGVALNCVANGKLLRRGIFEDIWIQPAAGDAGGALGAAYAAWHIGKEKNREIIPDQDSMEGTHLGPEFSSVDIVRVARKYQASFKYYSNFDELCKYVAELLAQGKVAGWFQGRMEYGPRALGNRSILGDPRHPEMQKRLNLKIKYREGFRPFAPSVLEEDMREYFELDFRSPYMLLVAPVQKKHRNPLPENYHHLGLFEKLYHLRSDIPAVTHVDYSARIQTVNKNTNHRFWKLINAFKQETGYGMLVNTSFNVRGEPIVCTPDDAYKCFMKTEMDCLVMEQFMFLKENQPALNDDDN
jgi:carbamoyltransferase